MRAEFGIVYIVFKRRPIVDLSECSDRAIQTVGFGWIFEHGTDRIADLDERPIVGTMNVQDVRNEGGEGVRRRACKLAPKTRRRIDNSSCLIHEVIGTRAI